MSVILTSMLQWTKFGDVGGDEAPCCGANEMHADTEQLRMRQARDRAEEKSGRGARKVERLRPKRRYPCAITHRTAAPGARAQEAATSCLRRVPPLIFSKNKQLCLYPPSPLSPRATMARLVEKRTGRLP